jgi:hypothetical protein
MAQYLRQKGTSQVYAIINGGAYYVPYDYAIANNVFPQVKDISNRVDQQYPISGNVNQAPKEADTTPDKSTTGAGATGTSTSTGAPFNPTTYGITTDLWNSLSAGQQALIESMSATARDQWMAGQLDVSINQDLLNKALSRAQSDPDIAAKYGDALVMDQANVQRSLNYIGAEYTQQKALTATQQEQDRIKLAESEAEAGRAYSGFREQAKQRLAQEQSGVIESSRRTLQQQLEQTGQSLEKAYGTAGLSQFGPVTAGGETYSPVGGITGSIAAQKKADVLSKQAQIFNLEKP